MDAAEFLGPGGPVSQKLSNYEVRPEQLDMARAVEAAQRKGRHLVVEAGTGVGKSFAYLVPSIIHALEAGKRAAISTYTISLQEQLMEKDIPLLQSAMTEEFKAVLVKGRSNYLCVRRLEVAAKRAATLFTTDQQIAELKGIIEWAYGATSGTLSDLNPQPSLPTWLRVCCEHGTCYGRKCPYESKCFYQRVRRQMMQADLLILNHALLFSDLAIRNTGNEFLPPYSNLVLDEAHNVENVACEAFGIEATSGQVRHLLEGLYNPQTNRGFLAGFVNPEVLQQVRGALATSGEFFDNVRDYLTEQAHTNGRIMQPQFVANSLSPELMKLHIALRGLMKQCASDDDRLELASQMERCLAMATSITEFVDQARERSVYWIEGEQRDPSLVGLHCNPVHVGEVLRRILFMKTDSVVLTSATLAVGHDKPFAYVRDRLGLVEADEALLGSPFDYQKQMEVYVEIALGDPNNASFFMPRAADAIMKYIKQTHGKAFILFTSYKMLRDMAERLKAPLKKMKINMFAQGMEMPRRIMLEKFRQDTDSVLLGTDSFWQGVDVQGESLSNVIITKLPFSVPDRPLIEARLDEIRNQGGNPFMDYQLPEAVLKFKQGAGRLVRTKQDHGIIVVLDQRVVGKQYGQTFLDSLPPCPVFIVGPDGARPQGKPAAKAKRAAK